MVGHGLCCTWSWWWLPRCCLLGLLGFYFWLVIWEETGHEYACGDMLEPRESDIPLLFLVLVVLPLVAYILLGKWSETTKKRNRINLLAHLAAEEGLRAEQMAVADVIPQLSQVHSSKNELHKNDLHKCARCSAPARTRCSRCKSARYW